MRHLIDPLDFTMEESLRLMDLADRIRQDPDRLSGRGGAQEAWRRCSMNPAPVPAFPLKRPCSTWAARSWDFPMPEFPAPPKARRWLIPFGSSAAMQTSAAMRHPKEGAPLRASRYSRIPVINAGDGGHSHPTQTLLDMLTIRRRKGRLDNLTIGFCGDLKFGRTVHSLIKSLARCEGMKFILISPEELRVPDYIIHEFLEPKNIPFMEVRSLEDALPDLDILYMTRVQKERFFNEEDYVRLKNSYILTEAKLGLAREDMAVLHPLPRVNEITLDVDNDPRAAYFEQVQNGVYIRMALIMTLLGLKDPLSRGGCVRMLKVDEIQNGVVIDHITAGTGMALYHLMELEKLPDASVALLQNVRSQKSGKKDIIKIEGDISKINFDVLGYLDPQISITCIENGHIAKKIRPDLPKRLVNVDQVQKSPLHHGH